MRQIAPTAVLAILVGLFGARYTRAQGFSLPTQKPFANVQLPSPVSPWLNLFRNDNSGISNYYTLVEPQLRQQQVNLQQQNVNRTQQAVVQRQERQLQDLSLQFRAQTQPRLGPTGNLRYVPAGYRFMNYSHYFGGR